MIRRVRIRGFKRFADAEFRLPGHVVLAGPNNTGKTTLLQAVSAWALALDRWKEVGKFRPGRRSFQRVPIARQAFTAVPLRHFDLLWTNRRPSNDVEIEIEHGSGWTVAVEISFNSSEQAYVRPRSDVDPEVLRDLALPVVFIPPMTGIAVEEPVFQAPKITQLLGRGRPGEVLRNLLVEAHAAAAAWAGLTESVSRLFGYELSSPDASGPDIRAGYRESGGKRELDLTSAGSGFQQVLMLLALLHTREGAILLVDEPDAHLHVILQDAIYRELRTLAARQDSQLIVATHSEVIVSAVEPRELCLTLSRPRMVADTEERNRLISSLRELGNADIVAASEARGVLYVENFTDINILRAWAARLGHRAHRLLLTEILWKPAVFDPGRGASGIRSREHFDAMRLVREDLPGLELLDGDAHPDIPDTAITGAGLQRLRWRRYEIESYLFHPDALARFVEARSPAAEAAARVDAMRSFLRAEFPPAMVADPLGDHEFLKATKARRHLIPPLLTAAGLGDVPYTAYHEIADRMAPEEIHPEVGEKLDAICRAFDVEP
ncbi:MAG: AAA family ATPase [Acidobacteria bacterium]|nr:AAA family ATPase [Acidobacteriota bacterium]